MGIALVATIAFVHGTPRPSHPTSILEPIRALRHRGLATMSVTALFYNWGFFTLLAYTPFLMHLGIRQLGYVFTCSGNPGRHSSPCLSLPRLQPRFGTPKTLYVGFALLAVDLLVIAIFSSSKTTLIVAVIVSGAFIGLNNTLTTQAVMSVSPVEKPIASASYGFVRFIGGGLAPYVASKLAVDINVHVPFYLGAVAVAAAIAVLATGHSLLTRAERGPEAELTVQSPSTTPNPPDGDIAPFTPVAVSTRTSGTYRRLPMVAAVDGNQKAAPVMDAAIEFARLFDTSVEVLHVVETDVLEELAVDRETPEAAHEIVAESLDRLRAAGIDGAGHLLRVVSGHGGAGRRIADFANEHHAGMIVIGAPVDSEIAEIFDSSLTDELLRHAQCAVHVVAPHPHPCASCYVGAQSVSPDPDRR